MKAKEYFEKYFGDIDSVSPDTLDLIKDRADKCFCELVDEILPLYKKRGSTASAMDGVIRELNSKGNAISGLMKKKYGASIFKRNALKNIWGDMLERYMKPKEPENSKSEETEG